MRRRVHDRGRGRRRRAPAAAAPRPSRPAATVEPVPERAPWCPCGPGSRSARRRPTWSLIPSFGYGGPVGAPEAAARWSRCRRTAARAPPSPRERHRAEARRPWPRGARPAPAMTRRPASRRPRTTVAEPQRRQHVERRRRRARRCGRVTRMQMSSGAGLGVVDRRCPSSGRSSKTPVSSSSYSGSCRPRRPFSATQVRVGERRLRVDVAPAHPRVRGRGVEVPPVLLGVLAVVALAARSGRRCAPSGSGRARSRRRTPGTAVWSSSQIPPSPSSFQR